LPAFRADPRCQVVALAGSDAARTATLVRASNVPKAHDSWQALVDAVNYKLMQGETGA